MTPCTHTLQIIVISTGITWHHSMRSPASPESRHKRNRNRPKNFFSPSFSFQVGQFIFVSPLRKCRSIDRQTMRVGVKKSKSYLLSSCLRLGSMNVLRAITRESSRSSTRNRHGYYAIIEWIDAFFPNDFSSVTGY